MKLNTVYGTSTNFTMTLASLPTGQARGSLAIDNSSDKYIDAMVTLKIQMASGTPTGQKLVNIYFYCSEDGSIYSDNASGTDQSITKRATTNWFGPYQLNTPTGGSLSYSAVIPSVGAYFGKILPRKWGIIVENLTGISLGALEDDFTKTYTGTSLQFSTPSTVMHDEATEADEGTDADVTALSSTNLQITGTATSSSITFYGSVDGVNFSEVSGLNLKTFNTASTTTGIDEIWQIDTSALKTLRADLTAVAGGNVTVTALSVP